MPVAFLGLGSNLGDRASFLRAAIARLESAETHVSAVSSAYETEHVGSPGERAPNYLNCVARIQTKLSPESLLEFTQYVERECGRTRPFPNAPRTLDIDILTYDCVVVATPRLTLPHPRLRGRAFALAPLVELEPGIRLPDGSAAAELLAMPDVAAQEYRRILVPLEPHQVRIVKSNA